MNYPGIDLADDQARVAFQITATSNSAKVKETPATFVKEGLYQKYDRLVILNLITMKAKTEVIGNIYEHPEVLKSETS